MSSPRSATSRRDPTTTSPIRSSIALRRARSAALSRSIAAAILSRSMPSEYRPRSLPAARRTRTDAALDDGRATDAVSRVFRRGQEKSHRFQWLLDAPERIRTSDLRFRRSLARRNFALFPGRMVQARLVGSACFQPVWDKARDKFRGVSPAAEPFGGVRSEASGTESAGTLSNSGSATPDDACGKPEPVTRSLPWKLLGFIGVPGVREAR